MALTKAAAGPDPNVVRLRPEPEVWSAIEYACHVRDVLEVQRLRIAQCLAEDRPVYAPMDRTGRVKQAQVREPGPDGGRGRADAVRPRVRCGRAGADAAAAGQAGSLQLPGTGAALAGLDHPPHRPRDPAPPPRHHHDPGAGRTADRPQAPRAGPTAERSRRPDDGRSAEPRRWRGTDWWEFSGAAQAAMAGSLVRWSRPAPRRRGADRRLVRRGENRRGRAAVEGHQAGWVGLLEDVTRPRPGAGSPGRRCVTTSGSWALTSPAIPVASA